MGILIVLDGTDRSGKKTQSKILTENLKATLGEEKVKHIEFPNYSSKSSELVKMYLHGELGENTEDINSYAASSFYAVDRYATFKSEGLFDYLKEDNIIIADRYTTSNIIHQCSKCGSDKEKLDMARWIEDIEYYKMGLPKPDLVVYLNRPLIDCIKSINTESTKINDGNSTDILESDTNFQENSKETGLFMAEHLGWKIVNFINEDRSIKDINEISNEIYSLVCGTLIQ